MPKKPSRTRKNPVAPDKSTSDSAPIVEAPELIKAAPPCGLSDASGAEAAAAQPPDQAPPAPEPPHLLTPLAALWPTTTPSTQPETPKPAPVAPNPPAPAVPKAVCVKFVLLDLGAKQVSLVGDFNGWAAGATPMKRQQSGHWEVTVELAPGRYEYKFVVDGQWAPDPFAHESIWNIHGTLNSVIQVKL